MPSRQRTPRSAPPLAAARRAALAIVALSAAIAVHPAPAYAIDSNATLTAPSAAYPTIQSAIDAARDGDTVQIENGIHRESLTIDGKYVSLRGNPDQQSVVLRAPAGRTPLMIQHVPGDPARPMTISGLRIEQGRAPSGQGGGITLAFDADPRITGNTLTGNVSVEQGGGILVFDHSDPVIERNRFVANEAGMFGGGVFVVKASAPRITGNLFERNVAHGASIPNGGSSGGAIYLENDVSAPGQKSKPVVRGNAVVDNTADFAGGGIMVRVGVDAIIEGNRIEGNQAAYGGGIHLESAGSRMTVRSNLIRANRAVAVPSFAGSGFGGGISVYDHSIPTIADNRIVENVSTSGGAGLAIAEGAEVVVRNNQFLSNRTASLESGDGGGVYVAHAKLDLTANQFIGNASRIGGAVALLDGSESSITGNEIVGNAVSATTPGGAVFVRELVTSATIDANTFRDNARYQIFEERSVAYLTDNVLTAASGLIYYNYATRGLSADAMNVRLGDHASGNVGEGHPGTQPASIAGHVTDALGSPVSGAAVITVWAIPIDVADPDRWTVDSAHRAVVDDDGAYTVYGLPAGSYRIAFTDRHPGSIVTPSDGLNYEDEFWEDARRLDDASPIALTTGQAVTGIDASLLFKFSDVPSSSTFYEPIRWMNERGLSTGYPTPTGREFRPTTAVSRQAMASFMYRYADPAYTSPATPTFRDVPASHTFYREIEWMAAEGISTGYDVGDGKEFRPTVPVTRQAMAQFLARFAGASPAPPATQVFADVPTAHQFAAAITWMKETGISTGTPQPDGLPLYKPNDAVSRQAMATFLQRLDALG